MREGNGNQWNLLCARTARATSLLTSGRRGAVPGKPRSGRRNRHREMALEEQMGCTTSRDKPWVVGLHTVSFLPCDKVHRLGW